MELLLKSYSLRRLLLIAGVISCFTFAVPSAKAEPISMVILAPLALKAANMASPYVIQWMKNSGDQFIVIGKDIVDIICLPLGMIQCTAGAPFGFFNNGLGNIRAGCAAPLKLCWDVLMLPLCIAGIGIGG